MSANDEEKKPVEETSGEENILEAERMGIVEEFWLFLRENKLYWIAPIAVVLLLLGVLVFLGSTGAAPFIYTLF